MKVVIIRWSRGHSCGEPGCTDPKCRCGVCNLPIGVPESDPRWNDHNPECLGCPLCEDEIPMILFRGEGKEMEQAQFHMKCFLKLRVLPGNAKETIH